MCASTLSMSKYIVKFMFSRKATKFDKIFTVDLKLCSKCQINGGLLKKHELKI